jgi:hypothetical protein
MIKDYITIARLFPSPESPNDLVISHRGRGHDWHRDMAFTLLLPLAVYGIACFYSRLEKTEEALFYFEKAVRAGFTQLEWIKNDADFDSIKKHPCFLSVMAELEKQREGTRCLQNPEVALLVSRAASTPSPLLRLSAAAESRQTIMENRLARYTD